MASEATVFIVDDNAGVRRSLRALMESVGLRAETFADADEFFAAYAPTRPGCLVLDLRLRDRSGLELQDELLRRQASLPVIVVTGHGTVPASVRAMKSGAFDFLQKPVPPRELVARVRDAIAADRRTRAEAERHAGVRHRLARLTRREKEVLRLLVAGKTSKEIATALRISVRTVEGHRRLLLLKMETESTALLLRSVLFADHDLLQTGAVRTLPT